MEIDVLMLSRFQFALTIMFHYLFPPLTIGLSVIMVIMEWLYLKTRNPIYESMTRFWTKIFAVNFALGVATGLVMEFQFGSNWATFSRYVGDVFGSALAAEGIFAFFLESGFLSILVFGWDRVSPRVHFISTIMVSLGSIFSAVWIVIANSWMQTPTGYALVQHGQFQRAEIVDFWAMVFNPSAMPRLAHVLVGALVLGAFFVMSITSYYILKSRHVEFAKRSFTIALIVGFIASLLAGLTGDTEARTVASTQPVKLAAFEGHFHTGKSGTPLYIFGVPDEMSEKVNFGLFIPGGLSFLLYGNFDTPVGGLDMVQGNDRPPVAIPFTTFHLMVGLGTFFIAITALALFLLMRKSLFQTNWLMILFVPSVIGPYIANECGWVSAEVGRQPWVVYGLFRTSQAVSPVLDKLQVLVSIIMFALIYLLLFLVWVYVMHQKISHGPDEVLMRPSDKENVLESAAMLLNPSGPSLIAVDKKLDDMNSE